VKYYVHAIDGQVYGPFDVASLNQWVGEGRIVPTTILQPENSQMRVAAATITDIHFGQQQTFQAYAPQRIDTGIQELRAAWICFAASLVLVCMPFGFHITAGIIGMVLGMMAYRKGHVLGLLAMILNLVLLGLFVTGRLGLLKLPFGGFGSSDGFNIRDM
jgi:hypothetical protein